MKRGYKIALLIGMVATTAVILSVITQLPTSAQAIRSPTITTIRIAPESSDPGADTDFEPKVTTVVIGVSNTVKWINTDNVVTWIRADNKNFDPGFFAATEIPGGTTTTLPSGEIVSTPSDLSTKIPNVLAPGEYFEYTFTVPGEYGFHGKPWQHGTIIVLPPQGGG
ncbi:MAG TPA: hypothetical protein VGQ13_10210 [Nitrososphaera sp.]|jgi:plastocyanin|nr:hypothetical protein [Nitrososphaera sp.]